MPPWKEKKEPVLYSKVVIRSLFLGNIFYMNELKHPRLNASRIHRHLKAALSSFPAGMSSKMLL